MGQGGDAVIFFIRFLPICWVEHFCTQQYLSNLNCWVDIDRHHFSPPLPPLPSFLQPPLLHKAKDSHPSTSSSAFGSCTLPYSNSYTEMRSAIFVSIFLVLALHCTFAANSFLASTLGSHMVLQRGVSTSVYGWSSVASSTVTVTMGTSIYSATSSASPSAAGGFFWQVPLPAMSASLLGTDIHISSTAGEAAALSDVLFGDVFFCSGQSRQQL